MSVSGTTAFAGRRGEGLDIPAEAMKGMVDGEKLSKEFMGANPYHTLPYPTGCPTTPTPAPYILRIHRTPYIIHSS